MKLTDAICRQAKPEAKTKKLSDGAGLALWIAPTGMKSWRLTYYVAGKQCFATLGHYPAMGLREARAAAVARRVGSTVSRASPTFGSVKAEWLALMERQGKAQSTLERARRMDRYSSPLDGRPIDEIKPPELLQLLRPLETSGRLETARRLRATLSRIFRHAASVGYADSDPTALLAGVIAAPQSTPRAAFTDKASFGVLLRAIDAYEGRGVREALLLLAYTAARPGEVRLATWGEFDLDAAVWTIPAGRMKMRREHRAPLARQVVGILCLAKSQANDLPESFTYVFPSQRPGRPLSENAFNTALRSMGFGKEEISAHGLRSAFSTLANESGLFSADAIERALAHVEQDATRRAYHRSDYFEERRRLMQWWADECERMMR